MWTDTEFEKQLKGILRKNLGSRGESLVGIFVNAKRVLAEEIYEEIKREEPDLSDHGPRHIANVFENISGLLGTELGRYRAEELFGLGMITLFHDVGNIYGRKRHNEKIKTIYSRVRSGATADRTEMVMVLQAAKAHTGDAADGTKDTLRDLDNNYYFLGQRIRLQEIAAILRMADELAEGPQRTSRFVLETHGYNEKNRIYHRYADCVSVSVDRERGRFALTYNMTVEQTEPGMKALEELLDFSYKRLLKLDQERRYTKFYCPVLSPFIASSATYRFWVGDDDYDLQLPALHIDDKIVPGDQAKTIPEMNPAYAPDAVSKKLKVMIEQEIANKGNARAEQDGQKVGAP